jgi:hypothetical protein
VKAATTGIRTPEDYSVWLKDRQHFHLRVFLGLSNAQGQRQTSTISIVRDNFGERKAKFHLETSRTTQMQLYKCIHVP